MIDSIKSIWDDLSYSVQKKSDKICQIKLEIAVTIKRSQHILVVGSIFGLYIILSVAKYINNGVIPEAFGLIQYFDIAILLITIVCIACWYSNELKRVKLKSEFELLRENLITAIDTEFCKHHGICSCKDAYIKGMESEDINLIFGCH